MERAVVVGRVVIVKAGLYHLIHEPAVDAFVEMGRFDSKQEKTKKSAQGDNQPGRPISLSEPVLPGLNLLPPGFVAPVVRGAGG